MFGRARHTESLYSIAYVVTFVDNLKLTQYYYEKISLDRMSRNVADNGRLQRRLS